jgi:hypothetical protein
MESDASTSLTFHHMRPMLCPLTRQIPIDENLGGIWVRRPVDQGDDAAAASRRMVPPSLSLSGASSSTGNPCCAALSISRQSA